MSDQTDPLKVLHDRLLAEMPDDATHDGCPICHGETTDSHTRGGFMPEAFTQEDIDAATAAATASLQQRLAELEAQVQETEVGQAVSKAVTEAVAAETARTAELQTQLDAAEAARTAAENRLAETEQFWTNAIADHETTAALAARREQRVTRASEAGVFTDEYITSNADRFAAMADEDFDARLAEWALIAAQSTSPAVTPARTALTASQTDSRATNSNLALLGEFTSRRVDPRALGGN
jgi:hypothetical protein